MNLSSGVKHNATSLGNHYVYNKKVHSNQLTGFYIRATMAFNRLNLILAVSIPLATIIWKSLRDRSRFPRKFSQNHGPWSSWPLVLVWFKTCLIFSIFTGFIWETNAATVFKTRLSLKEITKSLLMCRRHEYAA